MTNQAPSPTQVKGVVSAVGAVIATVIDFGGGLLPAKASAWIRKSRKAIVSTAGSFATLLTAIDVYSLPSNIAPWVAVALAVATGIATWAVPHEAAGDGGS